MRFNVKRYFQVLGIALAVVLVTVAVCMGINYDSDLGLSGSSEVLADVDNGKINVLALGVDVDGLRTDAMMLFSYDTGTKEMNILTIPRDTRMYVGNRYQKINAAHAYETNGVMGGPEASVEAVTRITGIPINFYVEFSFDAVAHIINILGPIEYTIPDLYGDGVGMVYDDPVQSLHINLPPGKYGEGDDCDYPGLTGEQAVQLLRYRHGNPDPVTGIFKGYTNGDEDRTQVQQEFIKAVVDQKLNLSLITKIPEIYQEIQAELKTNITFADVVKYAGNLTGLTSASMNSYTLPGEYGEDDANGDVWVPNLNEIRDLVQNVFGYDASDITADNPDDPDAAHPDPIVYEDTSAETEYYEDSGDEYYDYSADDEYYEDDYSDDEYEPSWETVE
ncbi:MAG: LCP family protein [Firmicutes bacterium]|nr:LCP family protein [Bacillota bacterium]